MPTRKFATPNRPTREERKEWRAAYYQKNKTAFVAAARVRKYGITSAEYDKMLEAQCGVCAICSKTETRRRSKQLCVDHDHSTGKVRGLLCSACNTALGLLRDNPGIIAQAAHYLTGA